MSNGKRPLDPEMGPDPAGGPGKNATENGSKIDEFIDRVQSSSHTGDTTVKAGNGKPAEKRAHETYSEINQSHDALLNELESSMDRSMAELDTRYDQEFSRLDRESREEEKSGPDTCAQQADRMEQRLRECGTKVEQLRARLERSEKEVLDRCSNEIEILKQQLAEAHRRLAKIEGTDEEGWGRVKESLSALAQDMSRAVKALVARVREAKARQ